jgi:hypothetical protein
MDRAGLINEIAEAVIIIYEGRRWLDTEGFEAKGRLRYHEGMAMVNEVFDEAQSLDELDLELIMRLERAYLAQELFSCDPEDKDSVDSIERAMAELEDALRALSALNEGAAYRIVDLAYPRKNDKYRKDGMPKDAFHVACNSHCTRIGNILKSPGINLTEKALLRRRYDNLRAARGVYVENQKVALATTEE